jgi:hypothetical protein
MTAINAWADGSAIANSMQERAYFAIREVNVLPNLVTQFSDMRGGNLRKNYTYSTNTAATIGETTDLTSTEFKPSASQTLTPEEIGLMYAVSDLRAESELPEDIINDGARDLGFAAAAKIESDLFSEFGSLTGGSAGGTGTSGTPTWGFVAAAIAQARDANKSSSIPLAVVMHGYTWAVLAKSASVAGASVASAYGDDISYNGYVSTFMGVPMFQIYPAVTGTGATAWAYGAVFPKSAIALDWRRQVRVEAQRDASMRGTEFNMSAVYAHGVWRPALGVYFCALAATPTS